MTREEELRERLLDCVKELERVKDERDKAVSQEREACAKIACGGGRAGDYASEGIAAAIRARGK
jgi:hypothetical protein